MIFHKLTLSNFGIFKGIQTFNLYPFKGKPIILIGGLNGRGKTTILEAVQIVLYGKLAPFLAEKKISYNNYLQDHQHQGMDESDVTYIELLFSHDGREPYRVIRKWSGVAEDFCIYQDNHEDALLTQTWYDYLEVQFPLRIAPLFLFDGERVESIADPEVTAAIIQSAIHSLLGISIVDKLEQDLKVFERRYISKLDPPGKEELEDLWGIETELERKIKEKTLGVANLNNFLDRIKKRKKEQEELFREEGGDLFLQRNKILSEIEKWQKEYLTIKEQILEIVSGCAPLLLVKNKLKKVKHQISKETESLNNRNILNVLQERDTELLKEVKTLCSGKMIETTIAAYLLNDRKIRETKIKGEIYLEMPHSICFKINEFQKQITNLRIKQKELIKTEILHNKKHIELKRKEAAIPLELNILPIYKKLLELEKEVEVINIKIGNIEKETTKLRIEENENRKKISKLLEKRLENKLTSEDYIRITHYAEKGRETIALFRNKIINIHLPKIAKEIDKSLKQILNKLNLFNSITINNNFTITMINSEGIKLSLKNLSAGERQLLAISILHGLAVYSGKDLPTIIDTPLGRLDHTHRENLVTKYFPKVGRQVILLSTDEEINSIFFNKLKPRLSRSYLLCYHEEEKYTEVKEGYFRV